MAYSAGSSRAMVIPRSLFPKLMHNAENRLAKIEHVDGDCDTPGVSGRSPEDVWQDHTSGERGQVSGVM
ncbi:hypothetical protein ACFLYP_02640 [Chloroflexota bacterium]